MSGHDFVRPFIMTGGRTATRGDLQVETLVRRAGAMTDAPLTSEQAAILERADAPVSVAELAAELELVVGVVAVLIADLLDAGLLQLADAGTHLHELDVLTRIANKMNSLR